MLLHTNSTLQSLGYTPRNERQKPLLNEMINIFLTLYLHILLITAYFSGANLCIIALAT